jgi:hypothetical protein
MMCEVNPGQAHVPEDLLRLDHGENPSSTNVRDDSLPTGKYVLVDD